MMMKLTRIPCKIRTFHAVCCGNPN